MKRSLLVGLLATSVLLSLAASAPPEGTGSSTDPPPEPTVAWGEITPLAVDEDHPLGGAQLRRLTGGDGTAGGAGAAGSLVLDRLPEGLTLLCAGGPATALHCEERHVRPGDRWEPRGRRGRTVTGRLVIDREPLEGAAVRLVPAELRTTRYLALPLEVPNAGAAATVALGEPVREMTTDRDGRFRLPPLAPGDYRLEIHLPGGRLDHGTTVSVPPVDPRELRSATEIAADGIAAVDLGEIPFSGGVAVEVLVTDRSGLPVAGARVGGGQDLGDGRSTLETVTDAEGRARLSGLAPDRPVGLVCTAPGHGWSRERFDAPPPFFACELEPLASLAGRVLDGTTGEPLAGATAALVRPAGYPEIAATTDAEGHFVLEDLDPGDHRVTLAAPGFASRRLGARLAAGQRRTLPPVHLEAGEEWTGS